MSIAIAWFTNETIFNILLEKLAEGVTVELILMNDHIINRINGLDLNEFIRNGGQLFFSNGQSLMHNKFAIIDDKCVVTGSYNWTYNAEFRNNENIVVLRDLSLVKKFEKEFTQLSSNAIKQQERVTIPPQSFKEVDYNAFLKNDFVSKSRFAEQKGELEKSIDAIKQAIKIDRNDQELTTRLDEVKRKYLPEYFYKVNDGQFSFDFRNEKLLGKEGDTINVIEPFDDEHNSEIYILYIDEFHVECIGNTESSFPKNDQEHQKIKELMLK